MTISLPLPGKKVKFSFYFIRYNMGEEDYCNYLSDVSLKESDNIQAFRLMVGEKLGYDPASFLVSNVENNQMRRMFGQSTKLEDVKSNHAHLLLYQIDPSLDANFKNIKSHDRIDGNYGLDNDWTMQVIHLGKHQRAYYNSSYYKFSASIIPRVMWINKKWSLK